MNDLNEEETRPSDLKQKIWEIVFEAETPAGKAFDVALLWLIVLSVLVVMLESVDSYAAKYGSLFIITECLYDSLHDRICFEIMVSEEAASLRV